MDPTALRERRDRILAFAATLPSAVAVQHPTHVSLEVRGKKFAYLLDDHHADARLALNCKAEPGLNEALAKARPDTHYLPPFVGPRGWVGYWLDLPEVDWEAIEDLVTEAWRLTAPPKVLALLGAKSPRS